MKGRKNTMLNTKQQEFVDYASKKFGTNELSVSELKEANKHFGCKYAPQWLIKNTDYKVGKSLFSYLLNQVWYLILILKAKLKKF